MSKPRSSLLREISFLIENLSLEQLVWYVYRSVSWHESQTSHEAVPAGGLVRLKFTIAVRFQFAFLGHFTFCGRVWDFTFSLLLFVIPLPNRDPKPYRHTQITRIRIHIRPFLWKFMRFFRYFLLETVNLLPFVVCKKREKKEREKRGRERERARRGEVGEESSYVACVR